MAVPKNHNQPHYRKLIRYQVVSLLKANVDVGGKVFPSRPLNLSVYELPCTLVYFVDETADHQGSAPRNYLRRLTMVTENLHTYLTETEMHLDDFLDSRAFEVEHALLDDRYLGLSGIVEDIELMRTEAINLTPEGDRAIASQRIFFSISYRTDYSFQGTLDEFLKFNAEYQLGISEISDDALAEDTVIIRTE